MEHIHTMPFPWELYDDFDRALAWQSIGVDDVLDVSVPVEHRSRCLVEGLPQAAVRLEQHPVLVREYSTPKGLLGTRCARPGKSRPRDGWSSPTWSR